MSKKECEINITNCYDNKDIIPCSFTMKDWINQIKNFVEENKKQNYDKKLDSQKRELEEIENHKTEI
jgi:hypothetical protein